MPQLHAEQGDILHDQKRLASESSVGLAEDETAAKRVRVAMAQAYAQNGFEMEDSSFDDDEVEGGSNSSAEYSSDQLDKERDSVIRMCYGKLHHMSAERIDTCLRKSVLIFNTMRTLQSEQLSLEEAPPVSAQPTESARLRVPHSIWELDDDGELDYRDPNAGAVAVVVDEADLEPPRLGWWGVVQHSEEEEMDEEEEEEEESSSSSSDGSGAQSSVWLSHSTGCGWSASGGAPMDTAELLPPVSQLPTLPSQLETTAAELAKSWSILNPASPPAAAQPHSHFPVFAAPSPQAGLGELLGLLEAEPITS